MNKGRESGAYVLSAMVSGLGSTGWAIGAILDGHGAELVFVGGVVGVAKVAQAIEVTGHAVDQRVVVGALLDVLTLASWLCRRSLR